MKKNFLLIILAILLPLAAGARNYDGECGDNLSWTIDTETYTLIISGTGDMYNYTYNVTDSCAPWYDYRDYIDYITVESGVTNIGDDAFTFCEYLKSATLPNTITSIGRRAFYGCKRLGEITIPNSVTRISDIAFAVCYKLKTITIPSSVVSIGRSILCVSRDLETVVVEPGNPVYDSRENCNAIIETATNTLVWGYENTVIPNTVTAIGDHAFSNCRKLTSIEIPNSVTSIGSDAFNYCIGLTSLTIPNSVVTIGKSAFDNCTKLTSIVLPDTLTTIEEKLFYCCTKLTSVIIPSNVTTIGRYAFGNCQAITDIALPNSVSYIGEGAFNNCMKLKTIIIPDLVTSIEKETFLKCDSLESITLPSNITSIGSRAFYECKSLKYIEIPESTTFIGYMAFRRCWNLTFVRSLAMVPPTCEDDNVFEKKTVESVTLYVPEDCVNVYKEAHEWSRFISIEELYPGQGVCENQQARVSLFPNPAESLINVNCENIRSLEIYSSDGKQVKRMTVFGSEAQVDISELGSGIYILNIETTHEIITKKLIVR